MLDILWADSSFPREQIYNLSISIEGWKVEDWISTEGIILQY